MSNAAKSSGFGAAGAAGVAEAAGAAEADEAVLVDVSVFLAGYADLVVVLWYDLEAVDGVDDEGYVRGVRVAVVDASRIARQACWAKRIEGAVDRARDMLDDRSRVQNGKKRRDGKQVADKEN
jgi:hypothetical protein